MEVENTMYSGVGIDFEYDAFDEDVPCTIDCYNQVIYTNELFFYIDERDVHFDNICRYLDERYDDEIASILNDNELIAYVEQKYNGTVCYGE